MNFFFCNECGQRLKNPTPDQTICDVCLAKATPSNDKDILTIEAYKWAESIIYKHAELEVGIQLILKKCSQESPSPFWAESEKLDFKEDIDRISAWLERAFTHPRNRPSDEIEFLTLALFDVEYGFQLVGSSRFLNSDLDEDELFTNDSYCFDEDDPVPEMAGCLSGVMRAWTYGLMDRTAGNGRFQHVGSWFATMAYAGVVGEHFFKSAPSELVLGGRSHRWFAVGSPEGGYKIILGQRTKEKWIPYKRKEE